MTMMLNGMQLPLFDQEGNLVFEDTDDIDAECIGAEKLLEGVSEELDKVDDIGTDLELSEDVNVYSWPGDSDDTYMSVVIYGGKNGSGIWSNYLKVLSDLLLRLEARYQDAWMIHLDIDCLDDLFAAEIGIRTWSLPEEAE